MKGIVTEILFVTITLLTYSKDVSSTVVEDKRETSTNKPEEKTNVITYHPKPCKMKCVYTDCLDALKHGHTNNGIYLIKPKSLFNIDPFYVYCDMKTDGGGWLVFQRRQDGSVDFFRGWAHYARGFGNIGGEFWLGNNKLNLITSQKQYTLRIDMSDFLGNSRYAKYTYFGVGDAYEKYKLRLGAYSGNAGDSLNHHGGKQFSTKDQDNDIHSAHCSQLYKGGWWYGKCHSSNLNGLYLRGSHTSYANGVNWKDWKGYKYSLKFTEMKIR